ncbi:hypothetical protein SKC37_02945 [Aquirufa sp. HETE-83D]|uniref:DUF1566 domain-containing protein n=1 Tax=Aquirufa esocilacus TaxID=3096513 RepID=A0ABW6DFX7_9BACT
MNKLYTILFLFVSFFAFSQNNGINFQGVGRNSSGAVLATQKISLRFSVIQGSETGAVEYVESKEVITNAQGIFSVVIGDGTQISKTGNFTDVNWKINPKFLKVEMDPAGGTSFAAMGTTRLQSVPFAYYANGVNADNIDGVLSASQGGTGVASISALKTALGIDQINNTSDLAKPISTATQAALDTKISTATFSTTVAIKANITDVELKAPIESPTFTGTVTGITKAMVGLPYVENTSDLSKPISTLTQIALDSKVSTNTFSTTVSLKENTANKSTAADLGGVSPSDILYPTQKAVKAYVNANAASGGIADGGIINIKLADGAVSYAKFQSIPTNTILGNTTSSTAMVQAIATTGSDNVVLSTSPLINSPILVTPNLGIATATSLNNITMTAAGGNPAILSVIGTASVKRDNNGDDAPNLRYENILTDGVVSLTTSQSIEGQKTFQNNLVMGTMGGIIGTNTPTTIDFANGSRIGDIQNIDAENPDDLGSIDLYAPDGAKWVQLNYANRNYIALKNSSISFSVNDKEWKLGEYGITTLPGPVFSGGNIYFSNIGITNLPNASIESNGPSFKIKTRSETFQEDADHVDYGIQLNFADKSRIDLLDDFMVSSVTDTANKQSSNLILSKNSLSFDFFDEVNSNENHWAFYGDDGSSLFPGEINVDIGGVNIFEGNLNLRQGKFKANGTFGTIGEVLTIDNNGYPVWQAPPVSSGSGSIAGISSMNNLTDLSQLFAVGTAGVDFNISSASGTHTFNIPDANTTNRGLLNSTDYTRFYNKQDAMDYVTDSRGGYLRAVDFNIFNNKQDALTNPLVGNGLNTNGEIPFFNGTNSISSDPNLFWDATHKRVGIGTNAPASPLEVRQGDEDEFGISLISHPRSANHANGSSIGFYSNVIDGNPSSTYNGSFQLDADGSMVFRTMQGGMYFDNAGTGSMIFRMGNPSANIGMSLSNSGNLEVAGTLKLGSVVYPKVSGTLGDVLTADASGNAIWQAPIGTSVDANSLAGSTLKSTIINSSLTSVGTLANLSVTNPINGSILGNAATVTTNANLTGVVTSVGNITSIATGTISNNMLANTAVANLSGVNTGDNAVNTRYSYLITDVANLLAANTGDNAINSRYNSLVTNAVHYGDIKPLMTGSDGYNVIGINGTRLLDLQTGILKNTNGTGVPSIAVASDFPTLNQSTTGNAATTTKFAISRNINGVAFDGTADITIAANAGTLTGTSLNSTVVNSSLTSVGTLSNLTVTNPINGSINGNAASATTATTAGTASTATKLATARNINGVAFDGSAAITVTADAGTLTGTTLKSTIINSSLTSVGTLINLSVTNPISGSITGNAATATLASSATKFATSRNINGIAFDGTGDITVAANAGTLMGTSLNTTITGSSLTSVGVLNNATVNGKVIVGAATESSSSAILEASSTTQGFLPPRMTIAQRLAITNPAQGLMIYCSNCGTYGEPQYYNGNSWINYAGTASSKGTPTINITVGTYIFTASTPQGPNAATNTGTGSTYAYTYVGTGSTTYASSSTRPTNAGTYSVTVSLSASGDGNYNAATASAAFTIAQAIPTVTPTIGTYNYISGTPQGPTAATNTGTGTSYTYSYTGTGITTYGPSATKPTDGGTYTVIATVATNGNYAASSSAPTAFSIKTNLSVGNTYGGGTVAYILKAGDIGYDANQQHGLIISGDLTPNNIVWSSNYGTMGSSGGAGIYNNDTGIEDFPSADLQTGLSNTNIIINVEGSGTSYAAGIARAYTGGNYTNWYLPSASQMNAMKTNLSTPFSTNYFWTSTEGGDYDAYAYSVPNRDVRGIDKISAQGKVRAVRSF